MTVVALSRGMARIAPSRSRGAARSATILATRTGFAGSRRTDPAAMADYSSGITDTATDMLCPRPPRITPRSGTTSAKSQPQASVR